VFGLRYGGGCCPFVGPSKSVSIRTGHLYDRKYSSIIICCIFLRAIRSVLCWRRAFSARHFSNGRDSDERNPKTWATVKTTVRFWVHSRQRFPWGSI
jgi:hypothetical protein